MNKDIILYSVSVGTLGGRPLICFFTNKDNAALIYSEINKSIKNKEDLILHNFSSFDTPGPVKEMIVLYKNIDYIFYDEYTYSQVIKLSEIYPRGEIPGLAVNFIQENKPYVKKT